MNFSEDEIKEFVTEAHDLLDSAEKSLLALDQGEVFSKHYDAIFRVYHSVKGAAGMMEMNALQSHMHQLETVFLERKQDPVLSKNHISFFLKGTDAARSIIEGEDVKFEFTISSVIKPAEEKIVAPAPSKKDAEAKKEIPTIGKILIVDDEPDIVSIVSDILEADGFEVLGTSKSTEAMTLIEKFKPDTVISDISMPEIDGFMLMTLIKEKHPELPVIFLSAFVDNNLLLKTVQHNLFSVLSKPFKPEHITRACYQAVKRYQLNKVLNRTMNLIMYQFSDLSDFLKAQGKEDIEKSIKHELELLLEQRRKINAFNKRAE